MPESVAQESFNAGELSPRMWGRTDQAIRANGLAEMLGFLPLLQGPALAMPGTHFVAVAKGPCRLIGFEPNVTQGYAIEASALAFRFFTNDEPLESAPDTLLEVVHPYSYDELLDLDHEESIDVLYLAGGGRASATLSRLAADDFAFAVEALRNGPIGSGNSNEAVTVTATGTTGTVTLTANNDIFLPEHVGGFFELEAHDFSTIKSWEPGMKGITLGSTKVSWAGKVYLAIAAADASPKTGSKPPIHDEGLEWDGQGGEDVNGKGPYGVQWEYLHNRYGLLTIASYVDTNEVTATVVNRLADSLTSVASWRWAHGAFSDAAGWPETVSLWDQARVLTNGKNVYASVIGDLDNFERRDSSGDFQRDLSGAFAVPDPIVWTAADGQLLLGTTKAERPYERLQIQNGIPGPPVFAEKKITSHGSRRIKPVNADSRILFVQRAGRKLRELDYQIGRDRYTCADMTRFADHIGAAGFVELAWQAEPERLLWTVLGDGALACMTYDPDQQVMGWARRELGGGLLAKSICRITDPAGERDQLWIAAATSDAEDAPWWILRMHKIHETGDAQEDGVYLDAALSYDGVPADEISGLDHLEGRTVSILADGKAHPDRVVTAGAVTLDYEASKVHVGLAFAARIKTLKPGANAEGGSVQDKTARVATLGLRLVETGGLRVTCNGLAEWEPVETRLTGDGMDEAVPLFTGLVDCNPIGHYNLDGDIEIERFQPLPACITAIYAGYEFGDSSGLGE